VSEGLFSRHTVEVGLRALVEELTSAGLTGTISIVGAAAVAWHVDRQALTRDIDALHPITPGPEFDAAVERVATAHGWPPNWLNDAVKMYASHFDTEGDWLVILEDSGVVVRVASVELLLAMKLLAGRGRRDSEDIDLLLDECGVTSAPEATAVFDRYYPTEEMAPAAARQVRARFG
jgi:hypothetical protein